MKVLSFGEMLIRLSPPDFTRFGQGTTFSIYYAGAEYNTAVSLSILGMNTSFVTRLPDNELSIAAIQNLKRYSVETNHICFGGKRIGIYYLEKGAVLRGAKVIYDREHSSIAEIEPGMIDWKTVCKGANWFHCTGITPALSEAAARETLLAVKTANQMGLTISIDLNYRSKLWQYGKQPQEVMPEILENCHVVLGDKSAADIYFGIRSDCKEEESYFDVMQKLQKRFTQLQHIFFSFRNTQSASNNSIGAFYYGNQQRLCSKIYQMQDMVERLGGGDALMAGIIYGLNTYPDKPQEALEFAVAASALKSSIQGDISFITLPEIQSLMQGNGTGRIMR